jgi:zeta-carotene desaturase
MKHHVVVIGGGFAGAAAASALAEEGVSVTLLEKRPFLGGRATSLKDGVTKEEVDNGPHLFMGCYRETRRFLRRLKVESRLRFMDRLEIPFLSSRGRSVLSARKWPLSLGLGWGLLRFKALSFRDRRSAASGMARLRFSRRKYGSDQTVSQRLAALRQTPGALKGFWTPLCLAALNADPDRASAAALDAVFDEGLFAGSEERALGWSRVALGKLWPVDLPGYLKSRGGVISTEQTVAGFELAGGRVARVKLEGGGSGDADAVVCAVPPPEFLALCPEVLKSRYAALEKTEFSPIVSVHLWFDRPVFDGPFAALLDTDFHWLFNRSVLWERQEGEGGRLSVMASDARALAGRPSEEVIARAVSDLKKVLPGLPDPRHACLMTEPRATPTPSPEFWRSRSPGATDVENLFLAGDWVESGLPPTIEAACRSGHAAAAAAKKYLDGIRAPC